MQPTGPLSPAVIDAFLQAHPMHTRSGQHQELLKSKHTLHRHQCTIGVRRDARLTCSKLTSCLHNVMFVLLRPVGNKGAWQKR
eukprot:4551790-Amphidinium_carterae.1